MGYNKGAEERKWKKAKEKEEQLLRDLGYPEEKIQDLRRYDWNDFKRNRNYRRFEHTNYNEDLDDRSFYSQKEILTIQDMFDAIEDEELLTYLKKTDPIVLFIILYETNDYPIKEIARIMNMSKNAIYKRMEKFRKKLPRKG